MPFTGYLSAVTYYKKSILTYICKTLYQIMNMIKKFTLLAFLTGVMGTISAQHTMCGMSTKDQAAMTEMFTHAGEGGTFLANRGDKIYIPVKFHLVADDNGKGRVGYNTILKQLDKLNADYAKHNFTFYLKDNYNFNHINNSAAYNSPRDNEDLLSTYKDPKAVNVFVVNNIGDSQAGIGIVLGYYSPSNDFVVMMASEAAKLSNTLSHELGHFFNLRHTFYGWESSPYDENEHGNPCVLTFAPGTNIQVEKVDKSNCNAAADQLCDTPPDYNFGITLNNCVFGKIVLDKNMDTIRPMKDNQMSYFSECASYQFTENQEARMRSNYNNSLRSYIRSSYVPVTDTLPATSVIIQPKAGAKADVYNNVVFDWEDQEATYYLLEIKNSNEYYYYFVTETSKEVTDLLPNKLYVWSVRAFHDGFTGTTSPQTPFRTGNVMTATKDINSNAAFKLVPNPVKRGNTAEIRIASVSSDNGLLTIVDVSGKMVKKSILPLTAGEQSVLLPVSDLSSGIYFVVINSTTGSFTQKLIIE